MLRYAKLLVHCLADSRYLQPVDNLYIFSFLDDSRGSGLVFEHVFIDKLRIL